MVGHAWTAFWGVILLQHVEERRLIGGCVAGSMWPLLSPDRPDVVSCRMSFDLTLRARAEQLTCLIRGNSDPAMIC
uniref:Protein stum homolog n=1 Tax=Phallusia mammillata TaxID=59560 RepID=A0A6F9DUH9_9ASCI|nr:protein stum homolog [Phallusia mammillata]